MNIKILYEDNHIIAAVKPFNMPSQEDASKDRDMLSELKDYIRQKYEKKGNAYLGLLHRLDRPAGGVMVFARTSKAAARLSAAMQKGGVQKVYYAVLPKKPPKKEDELTGYMIKDTQSNISRMASADEPGAKQARLKYTVLTEKQGLTLAKIDLYTGRPHQIRVQMKSIGCPLFGDMRYGGGEEKQQLALWAHSLTFEHPVKKESLKLSAEPPNAYPWNLFFYS